MNQADARNPDTLLIKPSKGWQVLSMRELWAYRELFYFLTWRDVKVRYKQTLFGAAWAVVQPLLLLGVFTIVFGEIGNVPTSGHPYALFVLPALVSWTLFSQSLSGAANSLVNNTNLVSKVYFPRLITPAAAAGSFVVDFGIGLGLIAVVFVGYGHTPPLQALTVPLFFLWALVAALAGGIWLSALTVRYRDVRYILPFLMQLLLFASPIGYSSESLGGWRELAYLANPVSGFAEGFRWALLDEPIEGATLIVPLLTTLFLFAFGLLYFKRSEKIFADVI